MTRARAGTLEPPPPALVAAPRAGQPFRRPPPLPARRRPRLVSPAADPNTATAEYPDDDAGYGWWRNAHPGGYVLAIHARRAPLLHRAGCDKVDRDAHPGALRARGARQICAETKTALRGWLAREVPGATGMIERCPRCGP